MPLTRRRVTDAAALKALAHPVRMALLGVLVTEGPMTASQAAALLDESPSNCSWHLRKLAEHHFVEEAGGGIGRQRPWQVSSIGLTWGNDDASPSELRAGRALEQMLLERQVGRYLRARTELDEDAEWAEAAEVSQSAGWMTPEELEELNREIRELQSRYADRITDPSARPPGSRLCELVAWGAPMLLPGLEATAEQPAETSGTMTGVDAS